MVSYGKVPLLKQGNSVRGPPPGEEEAAETTWDDLTAAPIPCPPVTLEGRGREFRSEAEPRKKGEKAGKYF